jgi:hypothetical protein
MKPPLTLLIAFCALAAPLVAQAAAPPKPNVIVIMADDLGAEGLGCCTLATEFLGDFSRANASPTFSAAERLVGVEERHTLSAGRPMNKRAKTRK